MRTRTGRKINANWKPGGWALLLSVPTMAPLPALLLLLLSIIATAAGETMLYIDDRLRLRLLLSVRPAVGCMLCVGEPMHLLEQSADSDSSPLSL